MSERDLYSSEESSLSNAERWARGLLAGQSRAVPRLLTLIENGAAGVDAAMALLYPRAGRAHVIGVTGPPGAGKSTLVAKLAQLFRDQDRRVGVIAVDPTSPFTGGALLGDRVRMQDLHADPGVFIRSMATRGSLGGLALATRDAIRVLDAAGYDVVLVETVGAGQSEVEIVRTAATVLVVLPPGLGDDVQAIKAGILEIADIFVVSKADREGADRVGAELRGMMDIDPRRKTRAWTPPIVKIVAPTGSGLPDLMAAIEKHDAFVREHEHGAERLRAQLRNELLEITQRRLMRDLEARATPAAIDALLDQLAARTLDPYAASSDLLRGVGWGGASSPR